ncbi:MAG TPA: response regulator [Puia sp.]|nr:response regulator [Puia sp.]
MKLPYVLLVDSDLARKNTFVKVFENQVAYATIFTMDDGQSFLAFLSERGWDDLPSLIILNYQLPDMNAPDILRELLIDHRYLHIPKFVWTSTLEKKETEEYRMLGIKHFFKSPVDLFELEAQVRKIDDLLNPELYR